MFDGVGTSSSTPSSSSDLEAVPGSQTSQRVFWTPPLVAPHIPPMMPPSSAPYAAPLAAIDGVPLAPAARVDSDLLVLPSAPYTRYTYRRRFSCPAWTKKFRYLESDRPPDTYW